MNKSTQSIQTQNMPQEHVSSFALSGRYVDEQVAAGRRLDDVLRDHDSIWFNRDALLPFSQAVCKAHRIENCGMSAESISSFALSGSYVDEQARLIEEKERLLKRLAELDAVLTQPVEVSQ